MTILLSVVVVLLTMILLSQWWLGTTPTVMISPEVEDYLHDMAQSLEALEQTCHDIRDAVEKVGP